MGTNLAMKTLLSSRATPRSNAIVDQRDYLSYIDGLRGVAILLVLLLHVSHTFLSSGFRFEIFHQYTEAGARGVQLFFILSALTLFNSSSRRFLTDKRPYVMFYIRRFFRIYPLWVLVLLVWAFVNHRTFAEVLPSLLFVFGFLRFDGFFEVVPGGWSLFVEETFYALLPILFLKIKNLYSAMILLICLLLTQAIWSKLALSVGILHSNQYDFFFPLNHWYAFGLGIAAYFLIKHEALKSIARSKRKVMLLDLLMFIALASYLPKEPVLASASLVSLVVISSMRSSLWFKLMNSRVLMQFGRYCYSIYLIHFILLLGLPMAGGALLGAIGLAGSSAEIKILIILPLFALANLALAFVTFNLIEKPGIKLGKKMTTLLQARTIKKEVETAKGPVEGLPIPSNL